MKKNEMSGAGSTDRGRRSAYRDLVGRPEGRRPFERPRRACEGNTKMDL